jgi:hypothetical protein
MVSASAPSVLTIAMAAWTTSEWLAADGRRLDRPTPGRNCFDTLLSQPRLGFEPFDQHLADGSDGAAQDAVGQSPPTRWARQTTEIVLVLSGLRTRGLADRVLVIVSADLAEQRREELERKFVLPTAMAGNAEPDVAAIIRW